MIIIPPRKTPSKVPPPRVVKPRYSVHIQEDLIKGEDGPKSNYTSKILAPIYHPKNKKPEPIELLDQSKAERLIAKIKASQNITEAERSFLIEAAKRHNVFYYKRIADYYAHASKPMQELMEESALVIIDFDSAIQNGYIKFSEEIKKLYVEEYESQK